MHLFGKVSSIGLVGLFSNALVSERREVVATAVGLVAHLELAWLDFSNSAFGVCIHLEISRLGDLFLVEQRH